MDWRELQRWSATQLDDFSGEIAYRTALRILPALSRDFSKSLISQEEHAPLLLACLRALITARVALDNPQTNVRGALQNSFAIISKYSGSYDYVARSVRAMLQVILDKKRDLSLEYTRKSIQAAKDCARNLPFGWAPRRREDFYPIDLGKEIRRDIDNISVGGGSNLTENVLDPRFANIFAWTNLVSHMEYYKQRWLPWIQWLEYRLFGINNSRLPDSLWAVVELEVARIRDEIWKDVEKANTEFCRIIDSAIEKYESEIAIERQNKSALTFCLNSEGRIDLDNTTNTAKFGGILTPLYQELEESTYQLLESCTDNSSSRVKERVLAYREVLTAVRTPASQVLLVVRGDSIRKELALQTELDEDSDIPPVKDTVLSLLRECVAKHNVFVSLDQSLCDVDRMLLGPDAVHELVPPSEIITLISQPAADRAITEEAKEALKEIARNAPVEPMASDRQSVRASESGKNLVRKAIEVLYSHKGKIGTAIVSVPAGLYGIGQWALANEATLLTYFRGNPAMHYAIQSILAWLHTLPLA